MDNGFTVVEHFVDLYVHLTKRPGLGVSHETALEFIKMYAGLKQATIIEGGLRSIGRSSRGLTGPG